MQMDTPSKTCGGLWNSPRPITYSKETQEMLKLMMQESHLANIQKRQLRECLKNGTPLHLACDSKPPPSPAQTKPSRPATSHLPSKPQRRSAEICRAGGSYIREKFIPGPTRDLEKEKRRLQNILATGKDTPTVCQRNVEVPQENDRSEEILEEIEERQQFLEDMASLGREREYAYIINYEITQRIRELELIDKSRSFTSEKVDRADEEMLDQNPLMLKHTSKVYGHLH